MFNKLVNFIEKYLSEPSKKMADNKYRRSIQEGYFAILPILIIGSLFIVLASLLQYCSR